MDAGEPYEWATKETQSPIRRARTARFGPRGEPGAAPSDPTPIDDLATLEGPVARVGQLARAIARRIRERPLSTVAVTMGVGFVVGGALSFRVGRIALGTAARHVARELLKQLL